MGQKCSSLDEDIKRIEYHMTTAALGEANYITACVQNFDPPGKKKDKKDVLNGKSKVSIEVNEHESVAHLKAQLCELGVIGPQWNITAVYSQNVNGSNVIYGHGGSLADQGVSAENATLLVKGIRKKQCIQMLRGHTSQVFFIAHQSDSRLMSASEDGSVRYWSPAGISKQTIRGLLNGVSCLALLAPNGKKLVTCCLDDNVARVWEAKKQWKCIHMLKGHADTICTVTAIDNGAFLATGSSDCTVRIWDSSSGGCCTILSGHTGSVLCVNQKSDRRILTGSTDNTIRLWDRYSEQCLQVLEAHTGDVTCMLSLWDPRALGSQITCFASGSRDQDVRIWNEIQEGDQKGMYECTHRMEGHSGEVTCMVQLSTKSNMLVTGSLDYTMRMWGLDGECMQVLEGHSGAISCVTELHDGRLASCSSDYTIRVWDEDCGESGDSAMNMNSTWFTGDDEQDNE